MVLLVVLCGCMTWREQLLPTAQTPLSTVACDLTPHMRVTTDRLTLLVDEAEVPHPFSVLTANWMREFALSD